MTTTRARLLLGCLLAAVLAAGAAAAPGGTMTFFTGNGIAHARGITTGPDGAIWFTNRDVNTIGRITTDGSSISAFADASIARPLAIVEGPDGALWFTNQNGDSIGRITVGGTITNYADDSIDFPSGMAVGADDALWFTNSDNGSIGRITTSGVISNYTDPSIVDPFFIVSGPDDALWFTNHEGDSIGRITTAGAVTNYTNPSILLPRGIAVGADGALWFSNEGNNSIGRITTDGDVSNFKAKGIDAPYGMAAGPDGALWFANQGKNSVGRITTSGRVQLFGSKSISNPVGITAGPDKGMWFSNADNDSLGRIEPLLPVDLSLPGGDATDAQIAIDKKGNAIAVWTRSDGSNTIVQAAVRPPGGEFGAPVDLSAAGQNASDPEVAIDKKGNAIAVWSRSDGTNTIIQGVKRSAGGTFEAVDDLSSPGQDAADPQITVDQKGNAIAVWTRSNGSNTIVQSAVWPAKGIAFGEAIDVSDLGQDASDPQIATDTKGNATAVWSSSDGIGSIVRSALRPAKTGIFGSPIDVSGLGLNVFGPQVTMDPKGNTIAVWSSSDGFGSVVQSAVRTAKSFDFGPVFTLSALGLDAFDPQIATDTKGNTTAVWSSSDGIGSIVQSAFRPAKTGIFGSPIDLSRLGLNAFDPQVAMDSNGNSMVVWNSSDGISSAIEGAFRSLKTGLFSLPSILSELGEDASAPQLDLDASGDPVTVFTGADGSDTIVEANDTLP